MLWRGWRSRWFGEVKPRTYVRAPLRLRVRPRLEPLEGREVPAITFDPIQNFTFPGGKDLLVPLTAVDSGGLDVSYSASSNNSGITTSLVTGGETVKLNVSGDGISGDIFLRLFDSLAPLAAARIDTLVNNHFYDGLNFHRVIEDFMAQGGSKNGDGTGSSGLAAFDDEFNPAITFVSPGLVAMANAGDDTNDSQFFIVDTDISLAQMPQHLNFNHTIVGQLVGGFDVFDKIMATPVEPQSPTNPENSKPVTPVVINSATIVADNHLGVLRIHSDPGFTGSASITVTATTTGDSQQQSFTVQSVADTVNDRPFLGALSDFSVSAGSPITFDIPATDLENDPLTFAVRNPLNFTAGPLNAAVTIDQAAHKATVTPQAGFVGDIDLLVGVRDQTLRSGVSLDDQGNFDTQKITLHVTRDIDLDTASDTGLYNDDNFTGQDAPSFTIHADAGRTVTLSLNGAGSFVTTESSPGVYTVTLPAGKLQLGPNTIGATVTGGSSPVTLAPLTVTYAPTLQGVYLVPGTPGSTQQLTFTLGSAESSFQSEVGFFIVDDLAGHIGTLAPGNAGYAKAALGSRQILVTRDQAAGATTTLAVKGGQFLGFYLIQNSSSDKFLSGNPNNRTSGAGPVAFFSFTTANPDHFDHVRITGDPTTGRMIYGWEDLTGGGDRDYNDRVITVRLAGDATPVAEALHVPANPGRQVAVTVKLLAAERSLLAAAATSPSTTSPGEVGVFIVDTADGRIGNLKPGDAGYAQAALGSSQVLFSTGDAANTQKTIDLPGGAFFGFYLVMNGTASAVISGNPNNSATGSPRAFFSFAAANPDAGVVHFRDFSPEKITEPEPTNNDPVRIHAMGALNGTSADFDDVLFTVSFASASSGPPVISSVSILPAKPHTNDTLTAAVIATDPDGDPITLTYVWKVNGVVKRMVTTPDTHDTFDLSVAGNGDPGQTVAVEVTPNDGAANGTMHSTSVTVS